MRKIQLVPWALAAVMAVALPGAPSAWALSNRETVKLLKAQLPPGVTLAKASVDETISALSSAISQHPEMATSLTEVAVVAKTPKPGQGKLSCKSLSKIVNAATTAAPQDSSDILQMALSMHPECADALSPVAPAGPESNAPNGFHTASDDYGGFGVGFGPGFPGSPGFTGSPPSGAIALPPDQVTSVLNG